MKSAELKAYRIEQFSFKNNARQTTKMELENKISYNVGYSNNTCRGELKATTTDKANPDAFSIEIVLSGIFSINTEAAKEQLHLETYDMLFPYAKAAVSMITAAAGIPPVILPYADISKQNIYRVEMPNKNNGDAKK